MALLVIGVKMAVAVSVTTEVMKVVAEGGSGSGFSGGFGNAGGFP